MAGWSAVPLMGDAAPSRYTYLSQLAQAVAQRQKALGMTSGITRKRRRQVALVEHIPLQSGLAMGQRFLCRADGHCYEITGLGPPVTYVDRGLHGVYNVANNTVADLLTYTNDLPQANDVACSAASFASIQNWISSNAGSFMPVDMDFATATYGTTHAYTFATLIAAAGLPGTSWTRKRYRLTTDAGKVTGSKAISGNSLVQWDGSAWQTVGPHGTKDVGTADILTFYGAAQLGDLVGSWLYNELQACLNKMVLTWGSEGWGNSAGHSFTSVDDAFYGGLPRYAHQNNGAWPDGTGGTLAASQDAAETSWNAAPNGNYAQRNAWAEASYISRNLPPYYSSIQVWGLAGKLTKPTNLKCIVKWYEYATLLRSVFADNSGTYARDRWNLVRTDAAGDAANVESDVAGKPTVVPRPRPAGTGSPTDVGRTISHMLAVCDWRCPGGFTYY